MPLLSPSIFLTMFQPKVAQRPNHASLISAHGPRVDEYEIHAIDRQTTTPGSATPNQANEPNLPRTNGRPRGCIFRGQAWVDTQTRRKAHHGPLRGSHWTLAGTLWPTSHGTASSQPSSAARCDSLGEDYRWGSVNNSSNLGSYSPRRRLVDV